MAATLGPWWASCGADRKQKIDSSKSASQTDAGTTRHSDPAPRATDAVVTHVQDASSAERDEREGIVTDAGASSRVVSMFAFRVTELYLRDPHIYLGVFDITDTPFLGTSVNGALIQNGLVMDYDMDGFVDVTILPIFQSLDTRAKTASLRLTDARCPVGDASRCQESTQPGFDVRWTIENRSQGACMEPLPGTTSNFTPAVGVPMAPCFVTTEGRDFTINLGGISIAMTAARLAARYEGDPPTRLVDGLLAGFVTDTHAKQALLPSSLPLIGGTPLSDYLHAAESDSAASPTGESGFWMYANFVATPVEYQTP